VQFTSTLSSLALLIISPSNAYIHGLVLPASQVVGLSIARAFSAEGRLKPVSEQAHFPNPFKFFPFQVLTTSKEFEYSRRPSSPTTSELQPEIKYVPCNKSVIWTPYFEEILVNGVVQGRKEHDIKGASAVSRRKIWALGKEVTRKETRNHRLRDVFAESSYRDVKRSLGGKETWRRRRVKDMVTEKLDGWVSNEGDDQFSI
jgi:tRNA-specific adenosine deaminase 1